MRACWRFTARALATAMATEWRAALMNDRPLPFAFQTAIIRRLATRRQALASASQVPISLYLAAEQGLGKTMIMLLAAERLGLRRLLVVAPAIGRLVWPAEADKWLQTKPLVHIPTSARDLERWVAAHATDQHDMPGPMQMIVLT